MNKLKVSAIALAAAVGLAACGGNNKSGDNTSTPTSPPVAAKESIIFSGSIINGAMYVSGARPDGGITGKDCVEEKPGCFDVLSEGDKVTFSLGSITLPEVTTTPGDQEVRTLDIARAVDAVEGQDFQLALFTISSALKALNDGETQVNDDGVEVFTLRPAVPGASPQTLINLIEIIAQNSNFNEPTSIASAIQNALAPVISNSTGTEVQPQDIDPNAFESSDLAKQAKGFEGGIESINNNPFGDTASLSFLTSDLLGLWSANNEAGANGLFYSDDGKLSVANTTAASPGSFSFIFENISWNIIDSVFISQSAAGERQCIVTERSSKQTFKLKCVDFPPSSSESTETTEFEVDYFKVNLASLLSTADGKWNLVVEQRFNETGSFTFKPDGTYTNTVTSTEEMLPEGEDRVSTVSGTYAVSGLILQFMINPDDLAEDEQDEANGSCAFAGIKRDVQGAIVDVYLRCGDLNDREDVLLTKREGVQPLIDTAPK